MLVRNLTVGCFALAFQNVAIEAYTNPVEGSVSVSNDIWNLNRELRVGDSTASNLLEIVGGSYVGSTTGFIGFDHNAFDNRVLVNDSVWENEYSLYIGLIGGRNGLEITNGGVVSAESAYVGYNASATNNAVYVSDGSTWDLSSKLDVGAYSSSNRVEVYDSSVSARTGMIGRNSSSYENVVAVDNSTLLFSDDLTLGGQGSRNLLLVNEGGRVQADGILSVGMDAEASKNLVLVSGSNSVVQSKVIFAGKGGSQNTLTAEGGGWIDAGNTFVGYDPSAANTLLRISGESSRLTTSELEVGTEGQRNQLHVEMGATASVLGAATIGRGSNAVSNVVLVDGADSHLAVGGALCVGADGRYNRLVVRRGGSLETQSAILGSGSYALNNRIEISSGSTWTNRKALQVSNGSTLLIGSEASVFTGSYTQDGSSTLVYGFDPDAGAAGVGLLQITDDAVFEAGAKIDVRAPLSQLTIDQTYTLLRARQIISGTLTNDISLLVPPQLLVDVGLSVTNGNTSLNYVRRSIVDATGMQGSVLEPLLNNIDEIAERNPQAEMMLQAMNYNGGSASAIADTLDQLYRRRVEIVSVVEQARVSSIGQIHAHVRTVQRAKQAQPLGAAGPHKAGQGWSPWAKGYGSKGRAQQKDQFSAYDARTYGGVFGVDRSFGAILGGIAAGYSNSTVDQDDGDNSEVNTYYGSLYASAGVRRWYVDMSLSYGRSSIDTYSGTGLGTTAGFNANDVAGYIGVGRQARHMRWSVTPQAAVIAGYYAQDSYSESSVLAVPTAVDAYDRWSVQSSLGLAIAYEQPFKHLVVKPELRVAWLHEFNTDEQDVNYQLIGGTAGNTFSVRSPDEDVVELGASLELLFADRLKLSMDLESQLSEFYEGYTVSGRIAFEF
jgi:T5SS/PEP-CTERM-associated repeat protein